MLRWLKAWVQKYDAWCHSMGLTPENKRSCVPYRKEPSREQEVSKHPTELGS
ncbi:DUF5363 domain-containing protein [Vibrio sp. ZSDE26]|uniref:DUF5363 domain-containing protein n=1 Tax=Vibrio amylolyticus TaxID=2847292 RepID=A0A9X1XHJ2_9VIBR|nr:DUF5363 family protein [Vibrio amylolyticus]MCK6262436.1 DUF5363 domain-containing protein [Vibrio amylolyticus]